jgi:hypothetical protein
VKAFEVRTKADLIAKFGIQGDQLELLRKTGHGFKHVTVVVETMGHRRVANCGIDEGAVAGLQSGHYLTPPTETFIGALNNPDAQRKMRDNETL